MTDPCTLSLLPHLLLQVKALLPGSRNLTLDRRDILRHISEHRRPIVHLFHLGPQRFLELVVSIRGIGIVGGDRSRHGGTDW